jgi:endonuclease/exonuclease/phosphatase (EEP) superfamily protein YafD
MLCAAVAPWVGADAWQPAMLLTYAPRVLCAGFAALLAVDFLLRKHPLRGLSMLATTGILVWQVGAGGGMHDVPDHHVGLLSYNVHHNAEGAPDLGVLVRDREVDIVCLQEVREEQRGVFVEALALADFRVFLPDETQSFEHDDFGPFSSLIAIRRSLLSSSDDVVETAITGYRTFAVRAEIAGQQLWVVNVHTTKPLWLQGGPIDLIQQAGPKATWHTSERDDLAAWLESHAGEPVIIAGDFNAPRSSRNLDLPTVTHAHEAAGDGPHLTYPAAFPVWDMDHVLGNDHVRFSAYESFDAGLSDHQAQLARFGLMGDGVRGVTVAGGLISR